MSSIQKLRNRIDTLIWLRNKAVSSLAGPCEIDERDREIATLERLYAAATRKAN